MRLDDFESVFRSAVKPRFDRQAIRLESILHVHDGDRKAAQVQAQALKAFLGSVDDGEHGAILTASREDWSSAEDLLAAIDKHKPQLVACSRRLGEPPSTLRTSVGSVVDALTQDSEVPVLLLPDGDAPLQPVVQSMVVTNHLTGHDRLVSWGVHFTPDHGTLLLAHVESEPTFARYAEALSRIPGFDTAETTRRLQEKLLGMARDYIGSVQQALEREGIQETVVPVVQMGEPVSTYQELLSHHEVQLLVCETKDPRQRAMEALGHALAVELTHLPLLLV